MGSAITHHHYLVICMLIASILEFLRSFNTQKFSLVWKWLIAGWQMRLLTCDAAGCRWGIRSGA